MNKINYIKETTLENAIGITDIRRDGNTTRLVDNAIQILFKGKTCVCLDHYNRGNDKYANRYLFEAILHRLESEFYYGINNLIIDRGNFEITLLNYED